MNENGPRVIDLQAERKRILFEVEALEDDIRRIAEQLEEVEGSDREETPWWFRARDAKRHKERNRRVLVAKAERLTRKINRVRPDRRKAEAKESLKEVLRTLFMVAKSSLDFYEDDTGDNETAFTDALDRLDQAVPGWDQPQGKKERPVLERITLGETSAT